MVTAAKKTNGATANFFSVIMVDANFKPTAIYMLVNFCVAVVSVKLLTEQTGVGIEFNLPGREKAAGPAHLVFHHLG